MKTASFFVAFLSSTNTNGACQSKKRKILVSNLTKVEAEYKQHVVKENSLLKGERDRLLQEAEGMRIQVPATRRRIRRVITIGKAPLQNSIEEKSLLSHWKAAFVICRIQSKKIVKVMCEVIAG